MSVVTIVIPVSRGEYLDQVFTSVELLEIGNLTVNILAIVDGDENLFIQTRNKVLNLKFNEKLCVKFSLRTKISQYNVLARRERIATIHNEVKQYLHSCHYVFLIEDDGVLPSNALMALYKEYLHDPYMGFITGMELGRWGIPYLGLWEVDNIYDINEVKSIQLPDKIKHIDASGIYCLLTKFEIYMSHTFKVYGENELGPDFDFGIELRKQGYFNKVHNLIKVKHLTKTGTVDIDKTDIAIIEFHKVNNKLRWRQQGYVKK